MPTLTFASPTVNPTPTVAEFALADRLAWSADGGEPDAYPGFGWDFIEPEDDAVESAFDQWLAENADELAEDAAGEAMVESCYRPF